MIQKIIILFFSFFLTGNALLAQSTWSLDRCIKHVQGANNSTIRSAQIEVDKAKVNKRQQLARRQPTLGAGGTLGVNLGRVDDPVTGVFDNQSIVYNSLYLSSDYSLYDGGRTKNAIEKSNIDIEILEADEEQFGKFLTLNILQTYLTILMADEQLENAKKNLTQTKEILALMQKLVRGGLMSEADLKSVEIQEARDRQKIIDRENFVNKNYVNLKNQLELDPSQPMKIKKPNNIKFTDKEIKNLSFSKVYNKALGTQPGIRSGDLKIKSAQLEEDIARGSGKPTVSLFGGLWSNYSSATKDFTKPILTDTFTLLNVWNDISINGTDFSDDLRWKTLEGIEYRSRSYPSQIWGNLGYGVGVRLYVPILDQKTSKLNAEMAHLNMRQTQEENNQVRQELKAEIQNAIHDVDAAANKLEAVEKTYELSEAAVGFMKKRLEFGNIDPLELKDVIGERDQAEFELVLAKYDLLLKKMVVEYYEGKPLNL